MAAKLFVIVDSFSNCGLRTGAIDSLVRFLEAHLQLKQQYHELQRAEELAQKAKENYQIQAN